jgi:hypothetical protein
LKPVNRETTARVTSPRAVRMYTDFVARLAGSTNVTVATSRPMKINAIPHASRQVACRYVPRLYRFSGGRLARVRRSIRSSLVLPVPMVEAASGRLLFDTSFRSEVLGYV